MFSTLIQESLCRTVSFCYEYALNGANSDQTERYVKTIVNRYKSSPNIFAWELMNEARCLGDLPGGLSCVPGSGTLHTWYSQQADFVRSLCVTSPRILHTYPYLVS